MHKNSLTYVCNYAIINKEGRKNFSSLNEYKNMNRRVVFVMTLILGFILLSLGIGASMGMGWLTMVVWNSLGIGQPIGFWVAWGLWVLLGMLFNKLKSDK